MARGVDPNSRYSRLLRDFERSLLQGYLDTCGSVEEAALQLGISTSTLYRRMKKLEITNKDEEQDSTQSQTKKRKRTKKSDVPRDVPIDDETKPEPFDTDLENNEDLASDENEIEEIEDEVEVEDEDNESWDDFFSDLPEDEDD